MYKSLNQSLFNKNGVIQQWFFVVLGFLSAILLMLLYYSSANHVQWKHLLKPKGISDNEKIAFISNKHPNIPVEYWMKIRTYEWLFHYKNLSCARFPNLLELNINQLHWQALYTPNATIQLFSAFYDTREITPGKSVRVLSMIDKNQISFKLYCHLWYTDVKEPVIVEVKKINYIQYAAWKLQSNSEVGPYLIECNVPEKQPVASPPIIVSIVANPCDRPKNMLKINYEVSENPENFAVCVKGLDFLHTDLSIRLVEWLELLFMFGTDKVFMYELSIHPNMRKVLNYYQSLGKVDLRHMTLPEGQMNIPILQHIYLVTTSEQEWLDELIPYNDCFYRNMYKYKYVTFLDIDEAIVPAKDENWMDMLERTKFQVDKENQYASYNVRNVFFMDEMTPTSKFDDSIPQYMHMLQHVYRSRNFSKPRTNVRSFFDTRYALSCHNNLPIDFSNRSEFTQDIPTEIGRLHHYKKTCPETLDCKDIMSDLVKDEVLWKFKRELMHRVKIVMDDLSLLVD